MSDDIETISNEERGCGHLERDKFYLKSEFHENGTLPPFVEFEDYIPYKENHFRGYRGFNGIAFELTVQPELTDTPQQSFNPNMDNPEMQKEVQNLIDRLKNDNPDGEHYGELVSTSTDLLMHVGETYYPEAEEFIEECKKQGLNKAIPAGKRNEPPRVNPGRTRVFIVHPHALGENQAGVIGYSYLTRVIYTAPEDGNIPKYVQDYEAAGKVDVVEPEEPKSENNNENTGLDQY